jgi:predicted alpha/beta superfamily hydrolase
MKVQTIRWDNHFSQFIDPRNVDIWLPPSYYEQPKQNYPVLYMHDGQNLFNRKDAYAKVDWGIVPAMHRLLQTGKVREAIIVGIWNTNKRVQEYLPWKPFTEISRGQVVYKKYQKKIGEVFSDAYLKFLVEELKPQVDSQFRTLPSQGDTSIMGSSLGGLISLYAICEYPHIFSGAGCVSTHWPILKQLMVNYLKAHLPDPATHRLYFDFGTEGIDADYERYQIKADKVLQKGGYVIGGNWITRKYEDHSHHESYWRKRVHIPLAFLIGK